MVNSTAALILRYSIRHQVGGWLDLAPQLKRYAKIQKYIVSLLASKHPKELVRLLLW